LKETVTIENFILIRIPLWRSFGKAFRPTTGCDREIFAGNGFVISDRLIPYTN
jgi:hypothetical protein